MSNIAIMEQWKDIKGYEGVYQISDLGRIKSLERVLLNGFKHTQKEKFLKIHFFTNGYRCVCLSKNGKGDKTSLHRLVAKHFVDNPNNYPEVNHKFGDKNDNRASSLEWTTKSLNNKHAYDNGLRRSYMKGRFGADNPSSVPIYQYDLSGNLLKKWESPTTIENIINLGRKQVTDVAKGRRDSYYGFIWKYKII